MSYCLDVIASVLHIRYDVPNSEPGDRMMLILRIARKALDSLVVLVLLLICSFGLGALGNLGIPSSPSSFSDWQYAAADTFWALVPLAVVFLAFKTRRWAGWVWLLSLPIAYYFALPMRFPLFLIHLYHQPMAGESSSWPEIAMGLLIVVGLYWLLTSALGCPPILAQGERPSSGRRKWAFFSGAMLVCGLGLAWTAVMAAIPIFFGECGGPPLFVKPESPSQAVFIATDVVQFGPDAYDPGHCAKLFCLLCFGSRQEHFWGLPWWDRKVLILVRPCSWHGESYLIDGNRPSGILARFLPIVTMRQCGRTDLVTGADIELRVLKDGRTRLGGRIIGYVYRHIDGTRQRQEGIKVTLTGPTGSIVSTTDVKGIFDFPGLLTGTYSIQADLPPKSQVGWLRCPRPFLLAPEEIIECSVYYE